MSLEMSEELDEEKSSSSVEDILKKDLTADSRLKTIDILDLSPKKQIVASPIEGKNSNNSLQCCCAGMFDLDLELVPNFECHPDGCMMAFNSWIASKELNLRIFQLTKEGALQQEETPSNLGASYITSGSICILQSTTGYMVGQVVMKGGDVNDGGSGSVLNVKVIMDPNSPPSGEEDSTGGTSPQNENKKSEMEVPPHSALFIYRSTTKYNKYYYSDQVGGYVGKNDLRQYSFGQN